MRIKESAENYLETIFVLKKKNGFARGIDVANKLGFTKASVSVAMKSLRESGYITVDSKGEICLTDDGLEIAEKMYERHQIIAKFLIALGVSEDIAYEDSCKIEHAISTQSFDKLKDYLSKNNII